MIPLRTKQIVEVYVYGACSSATKSNEKGNNNILNAKSD